MVPILSRSIARPVHAGTFQAEPQSGVLPQVRYCSPCTQRGSGGQWCVQLPTLGRRCVNLPSPGKWQLCCDVRWGGTPVACGIKRC
jgi:hypothetical protein